SGRLCHDQEQRAGRGRAQLGGGGQRGRHPCRRRGGGGAQSRGGPPSAAGQRAVRTGAPADQRRRPAGVDAVAAAGSGRRRSVAGVDAREHLEARGPGGAGEGQDAERFAPAKQLTRISSMKTSLYFGMALIAAGCATVTPPELITARASYARASTGPAVQLLPADLHKAKVVLDAAEASFVKEKGSSETIDLAYIADRTIQIVEAQAQTALAAQTVAKAKQDYQDKQAAIMKKTQASLATTRQRLTDAQRGQAEEAEQLGVERAAREAADTKAAASEQRALASEQKTIEANDALAKLAAKDEARGLVITLSGAVLFRSNQATLLPGATARLDDVAVALIAN